MYNVRICMCIYVYVCGVGWGWGTHALVASFHIVPYACGLLYACNCVMYTLHIYVRMYTHIVPYSKAFRRAVTQLHNTI